jgi:hypothetical protein
MIYNKYVVETCGVLVVGEALDFSSIIWMRQLAF